MTQDLRATVALPKTTFAMKANLPQREPEILASWTEQDLYRRLREASADRERFVLHDGPPYANGHLHMGTALNKILKDVVNRSQQMLGKDAAYVPGWDCHGLPIEWNIEQQYRAKGKDKDQVPIVAFRRQCREYAEKWIRVQMTEFQRLGVLGDWAAPYTTMSFAAEAGIFEELAKFLMSGRLYRGHKSVMWSVVEKTALAEAEVEYHDHSSHTIWVRFPVVETANPVLAGAAVVIWTTTPWTMPANRAVAYGDALAYRLVEVSGVAEGSHASVGERLVLADALVDDVCDAAGITATTTVATFAGRDLAGTVVAHPLRGKGYEYGVPLLAGGFVTTEQGTGLVHIAPSHGADDFELGALHGLEVPDTVDEAGHYTTAVPGFEGLHVFEAHEPVIQALVDAGALLARGKLVHSYPHSWRSKAPVIFRATPQWFIAMDDDHGLRRTALDAIAATRFVPAAGANRLRGMVESRPDWCVSRQRAWGVPIAVFVHKGTGDVLRDAEVAARIAQAFREEGADAWWSRDPQDFLGNAYAAADYEKIDDILDVWFDSGSTHATVLEQRSELRWPASLYLEGSDQHRGWFQSSLLESCGTRGRAPFDAVLTHGFVVDAEGRKMSKSLGNGVEVQDLLKSYGADIVRLWVVSADFTEDVRIGDEILKRQADAYRRLRNTLRYLLGNLAGFGATERVDPADMPELERWVLGELVRLDRQVREANGAFDFDRLYGALHDFCAVELSAFYFDVRKDVLYCDPPSSLRRRAARTVLDVLFDTLVRWLAPVLVFTTEEAWRARHGVDAASIHLQDFRAVPAAWLDDAVAGCWQRLREIRRVVTGALEIERRDKRIGSSLEAAPLVHVDEGDRDLLQSVNFAELCITSGITLSVDPAPPDAFRLEDVAGVAVVPGLASGEKCARCWQCFPSVDGDGLCARCADAVAEHRAVA